MRYFELIDFLSYFHSIRKIAVITFLARKYTILLLYLKIFQYVHDLKVDRKYITLRDPYLHKQLYIFQQVKHTNKSRYTPQFSLYL